MTFDIMFCGLVFRAIVGVKLCPQHKASKMKSTVREERPSIVWIKIKKDKLSSHHIGIFWKTVGSLCIFMKHMPLKLYKLPIR